jgi:hypothetical protein
MPGQARTTSYTALGAIDAMQRAYIRFVPDDPSFPEAVTLLKAGYGSTLHHAELRAAAINAHGAIAITSYDLLEPGDVPALFGAND